MKPSPSWKTGLLFVVIAIVLMSLLATFDLTVLAPQRLEKIRQARREAPPKLVLPSQRPDSQPAREVLTAFRIEEWRLKETPKDAEVSRWVPNDVYLRGYLFVREAEQLIEDGNLVGARGKYEQAAKVFDMISEREPDFEPAMVKFRRNKINEALEKLTGSPVDSGTGKPQSFLDGHQSGAVDSPTEVRLALRGL